MFSSNTSQVSNAATYIEDVFSTWLYTGTNTAPNTITNGIDLSTKGGLVWVKSRSTAKGHFLYDTARGAQKMLQTNSTAAQVDDGAGGATSGLYAFNTNGFTLGTDYFGEPNQSGANLASWTFRKQPKFFDVVTYTGNGTAGRTVAHSLGSVPGFIIIKATGVSNNWVTYHRSMGNTSYMFFNTTGAQSSVYNLWNNTTPTATEFTLGSDSYVNANGYEYVAYLFAHNAGGFGLTGTDNVISCGSYTTDGSGNASVTLGYEPQWLMIKSSTATENWIILDNMRGIVTGGTDPTLYANLSSAEATASNRLDLSATGFVVNPNTFNVSTPNTTYIYIAIRRGPMKTPTSGTSVFGINAFTGDGSGTRQITTQGVTTDLILSKIRSGYGSNDYPTMWTDRLRGGTSLGISSNQGDADSYWSLSGWYNFAVMDGYAIGGTVYAYSNQSGGTNYVSYGLKRAPSFADVVCYRGSGATQTVSHNLGVAPELMIIKERGSTYTSWVVYCSYLTSPTTSILLMNLDIPRDTGYTTFFNSTAPTATSITLGAGASVNNSGSNFLAYLFASCPGVSKVGTYSGTGGTQTISCGFAARFVMIKRTDSTGDWWFWDTTRGMVAGTDPRSSFNGVAAENNANWVYTNASGFQIVTTDATVNASGGSYIFLAIA